MTIELSHPTVVSFYQKHPNIDIEDVNLMMVNFMEMVIGTNNTEQSISEIILQRVSKLETAVTDTLDSKYANILQDQLQTTVNTIQSNLREIINSTGRDSTKGAFDDVQTAMFQRMDSKLESLISKIHQPMCDNMNESERRITSKMELIHNTTSQNQTTQNGLVTCFNDYLNKLKHSSSLKGQYGENKLMLILENMYPQGILESFSIEKTNSIKKSGDVILVRNEPKPKILIENKVYESKKVPEEEVEKFIRDTTEQQCHGIMLSQEKEIAGKRSFQIDMNKNKILVYVDKVKYDSFKIGLAVDIIDILDSKLSQYLSAGANDHAEIAPEVMDNINTEFQQFAKTKEDFYVLIQDQTRKLTKQLNTMNFPSLEGVLNGIYATSKQTKITCRYCNREFKGRFPAKAIARHEPSCKMNHANSV